MNKNSRKQAVEALKSISRYLGYSKNNEISIKMIPQICGIDMRLGQNKTLKGIQIAKKVSELCSESNLIFGSKEVRCFGRSREEVYEFFPRTGFQEKIQEILEKESRLKTA